VLFCLLSFVGKLFRGFCGCHETPVTNLWLCPARYTCRTSKDPRRQRPISSLFLCRNYYFIMLYRCIVLMVYRRICGYGNDIRHRPTNLHMSVADPEFWNEAGKGFLRFLNPPLHAVALLSVRRSSKSFRFRPTVI